MLYPLYIYSTYFKCYLYRYIVISIYRNIYIVINIRLYMPNDLSDLYIMFLSVFILGFLYLFKHLKLIGIRTKGKREKIDKREI